MHRIITILAALLSSVFAISSDDIGSISSVALYALLVVVLTDVHKRRTVSLLQSWQAAFLFIVLSESILYAAEPMRFGGEHGVGVGENGLLIATRFLIVANNLVVLGYALSRERPGAPSLQRVEAPRRSTFGIFTYVSVVTLAVVFVAYQLPVVLVAFTEGRTAAYESTEHSVVLDAAIGSIGLVLPAIVALMVRSVGGAVTFLFGMTICLPIFTVLLLSGTRFPLLFSLGGFALIYEQGRQRSKIGRYVVAAAFVLLVVASSAMKSSRSRGFARDIEQWGSKEPDSTSVSTKIAGWMSPEGVVDMTALLFHHFGEHDHLYGASTSFILYSWIPRSVWPGKPTMLGHWVIREYRRGFAAGHSSSFGFTGELFSDFGYFTLLICLFMGIGLRRLTQWQMNAVGYQRVLAAMLYPVTFFFVRSPMTTLINFIGIFGIYWGIGKLTGASSK